jgi:hypothetical protein
MAEHVIELVAVDCYQPGYTIDLRVNGMTTAYTLAAGDALVIYDDDPDGRHVAVRHPMTEETAV